MLALIVYVVFAAQPPLGEAVYRTFIPAEINFRMIVTLVGGTVGGYITFAGAHRLIDAGISGPEAIPDVNRSAVTGIILTAAIRILLFLAALGVVSLGVKLDPANPPASVFLSAAGQVGYKLFGIVMWAAAITSVVGAAYTSVSFFKNFHAKLESRGNQVIVAFIVFSTLLFLTVGRPVSVLLWAGTLNGFILPIGLALVLLASRQTKAMKGYVHSTFLQIAGWLVVVIMTTFSILTVVEAIR
jgi:Mn2+/Fe2+ NRAMP family transporter